MLYIEKKVPPQAYQRAVATIKGAPTWRLVQDGDTTAIRSQFDLLPKAEILNEVLRLNGKAGRDTATELIKGRRDAYRQAQKLYTELAKHGKLTSVRINRIIQTIEQKDEYPEFAGTLLFFLNRKRKQLESQGK